MVPVFRSQELQKKVFTAYDNLLELWEIPVEQCTVPTDYGNTHVLCAGDRKNPPLVLFHGEREHSAIAWFEGAKALQQSFFLLAVDVLGTPGKTVPNATYRTLLDPVRWVHQILDYFSFPSAYFCGIGKGGYLAQLYTAVASGRVRGTAVLGEPLAVQAPLSRRFRVARATYPWASLPQGRGIAQLTQRLGGKSLRRSLQSPRLQKEYRLLLQSYRPSAGRWLTVRALNPAELVTLKQKSIFFIGGKDPLAYHTYAREKLAEHQLPLITFEGAGHYLHHEIPSLVFPLVRFHLESFPKTS